VSEFPHATFFIESSSDQCKEFLPDESGMHGIICGAPVVAGRSYCACHLRINFQPIKKGVKFNIADYSVRRGPDPDDQEADLTEMLS
jgi:hypothetical protein